MRLGGMRKLPYLSTPMLFSFGSKHSHAGFIVIERVHIYSFKTRTEGHIIMIYEYYIWI